MMNETTKQQYIALLRERLKPQRFLHSLNVAESAVSLARRFGADEEKAEIAGLLHDITKNETDENQLQILAQNDILLSPVERANPKLWHAMTAPLFIKNELGISDEEILGAVRYHTTGKAGMNLLEKVVYIADYISAERDYPDADIMRVLSEKSLEQAALYALKYSFRSLSEKQKPIHEDSLAFYNELVIQSMKG